MKKLKAYLGLKIVSFGIWLLEQEPYEMWDFKDKEDAKRLWDYYDRFTKELNPNKP